MKWIMLKKLTPTQPNIIVAYHTSGYRLVIEIGWWSTIPIPRDNKYCHFCAYNVVENKAHFLLECPLLDISFLLFENVILGSLKSFFQLDPQVDVGHYVTKLTALCYFKKLACLAPS